MDPNMVGMVLMLRCGSPLEKTLHDANASLSGLGECELWEETFRIAGPYKEAHHIGDFLAPLLHGREYQETGLKVWEQKQQRTTQQ
eukprot:6401130-Amphidinium_carterae.1